MKIKLNKILCLSLITILLLSIMTSSIIADVPSEPHNANAMWVEPSSITFSPANASIGTKFNVTVWLNITSEDIFGWQLGFYYNRTYLRCTRSDFTGAPGGPSQFMTGHSTSVSGPLIDTSFLGNGSILAFESCKGSDYIPKPRSGSLIWAEFEILMMPEEGQTLTSKFDISKSYPTRTWAKNRSLVVIPLTPFDGTYQFFSGAPPPTYTLTITATSGGTTNPLPGIYTYPSGTNVSVTATADINYRFDHWELDGANIGTTSPVNVTMNKNHILHAVFVYSPPGSKLYVDPHEIIDTSMLPCSTFSVNITIDDVGNLKICEFNLTYNTQVLGIISVGLLKVQNQYPTARIILDDDDAGFIWVNLTYSTPITTDIPIALVTIQFHVEALGASPLDLHDTHFIDPNGQPIAHEAIDGFFATLIRDVAIINVVPSRSWVYQGFYVNITVTAKNKGNVNETFNVSAYYDSNLIGNITVIDLPPGNETTMIFTWNTTSVPYCHNYTISAQTEILPYELNTTDNTYIDGKVKIRIYGDITGNGEVDGSDLAIASLAFASYPSHPRWNPEADINEDGVVDGLDIILIALNYGKSCPP